jgi:hypothetical protein
MRSVGKRKRTTRSRGYNSLSDLQQEVRRRSLDAVKFMRERGYSLRRAAREAGTTSGSVLRYGKSAIVKRGRQYKARSSDRLRRDLVFYNRKGQYILTTHSSRQASQIGKYHNAIRAYLVHGDDSALREFEGKSIVVHGKAYPFVTDRRVVNRLARAGELQFLDLYASGGAA